MQGFDVNIGGRGWGSPGRRGYHSPYHFPNLTQDKKGEYLTDRLTQEAMRFIEKHRATHFFLYLSHYAVHTPIQAKADVTAKYQAKAPASGHDNAEYAAMIESVDDSVGAVLKKLDELRLAENTVVLFFSDNGGLLRVTSNAPLRGGKGMLYEGGIREPLIIKWPGVTKAGDRCNEPVIGVDLYPTFLEIAGAPRPEGYTLDGVSLVPLLKNPSAGLGRDALYWHFPAYLQAYRGANMGPFRTTPAGAIRMGDWKLVEFFEDGKRELYNVAQDLSERTNLAAAMPEKAAELSAALVAWRKQVEAPVPTVPNPRYDPNATWPPAKKARRQRERRSGG
jgi:arylsulfatase A-like enzyme